MSRGTLLLVVGGLSLLVAGCRDDSVSPESTAPPPSGVMPDFSLRDVNPNSSTYDQQVSPRQFLGAIAAIYFGYAT